MRHPHLVHSAGLLLALASAGCVGGPPGEEPPDPEQLFELYSTTATYLYEDGSLQRAQDQAVKALEIEPHDLPMRRMVGWIRLRLGGNEDLIIAEQMFRRLYEGGDENQTTVLGLATAAERLGTAYSRAARAFRTGQRIPEEGQSPAEAAEALEAKAEAHWREALALYERTLQGGEGSTRSMNGLQRVHALLGHYEDSLAWSRVLLERSRKELEAWRRMLSSEDLTESEERLFRTNEAAAVELRTQTHLFAATLLHDLGRYDAAVRHLDEVIAVSPDMPEVYSQRAQLYARLGEYERAISDLQRFLGLSDAPPDDADIRRAFDLLTECQTRLAASAANG